jgi:hypothetical protein
MSELLFAINKYVWIADFTFLCILLAIAKSHKEISSSALTLIVTVLMSGVLIQYHTFALAISPPVGNGTDLMFWLFGFLIMDCFMMFVFYKQYQWLKQRYGKPVLSRLFIGFGVAVLACALYMQIGQLWFDVIGPSYKTWGRVAYYLGIAALDGLVIYLIHQSHLFAKLRYSLIARMYLMAFYIAALLQTIRFLERYTWDTNYLAALYRWGLMSVNLTTSSVVLVLTCLAVFNQFADKKREGALWNI